MNIGMLWFDNDPKIELNKKIERAASYYRDKYGAAPTLCYVHPSMVGSGDKALAGHNGNGSAGTKANKGLITSGVEVKTTPTVLPNHFWIGVNGARDNNLPEAK